MPTAMPHPADTRALRATPEQDAHLWQSFNSFNKQGGKFRVALINHCNLNCFFCHNEGMPNPRFSNAVGPGTKINRTRFHRPDMNDDRILQIINTYCAMGGASVNITGGEPLIHPNFFEIIEAIDKKDTVLNVNTNLLAAGRLLKRARLPQIDAFYVSLHTTREDTQSNSLGGGSAARVIESIKAVRDFGYKILLNCSIGPHNIEDFPGVLNFALTEAIDLKVIALVRHNDKPDYYGGDWINPRQLDQILFQAGARLLNKQTSLGGAKTTYQVGNTRVIIKNIAEGRLFTSFCKDCTKRSHCGEGIYGLRVGVDGLWKPCLLRDDAYTLINNHDLQQQILENIHAMMGTPEEIHLIKGIPQ